MKENIWGDLVEEMATNLPKLTQLLGRNDQYYRRKYCQDGNVDFIDILRALRGWNFSSKNFTEEEKEVIRWGLKEADSQMASIRHDLEYTHKEVIDLFDEHFFTKKELELVQQFADLEYDACAKEQDEEEVVHSERCSSIINNFREQKSDELIAPDLEFIKALTEVYEEMVTESEYKLIEIIRDKCDKRIAELKPAKRTRR